ncbi:type II toxin-antitoxin system Phd/YefM family antitoxin [Actinomadura alba]|uniref:Antitoxin n=1 Tax=Actinomadura alba TaxID=406431 RepID=A0ABR7LJH7_9ACTN|nr:type II toxin-antitoxin system Phd/YefM family antitoxin [Actinomadura alba]MBC6464910.1 type II toxin-antitoxin system Phd/YefM family antitoxin [Actinomadura alba]
MTTLPLAEVRHNLSRLVDSAVTTHERVEITRNGVPAAILLSIDDYEAMQETIEILADAETLDALREGMADIAAQRTYAPAEVERAMRDAGRL